MVSLPSKAEKPWLAKNVLLCLCRSTGVGAQTAIIPELYDLYDLAHVARWEPYNLHHLGHVLLGRVYTMQVSHNQSRAGRFGSK